jgi:hypothetical protein
MFKIVRVIVAACTLSLCTLSVAHADSKQGTTRAKCKAPTGQIFAEGETIQLPVTDSNGNIKAQTYVCTANGWEKAARIRRASPPSVSRPLNKNN